MKKINLYILFLVVIVAIITGIYLYKKNKSNYYYSTPYGRYYNYWYGRSWGYPYGSYSYHRCSRCSKCRRNYYGRTCGYCAR